MDWIMQTLTQLGEHFGLVLIACVELAAAVALLIKGQHKKEGTPIQTARGRGARDLLLQELDRRSDQVFILMRRSDLMPIAAVGNTQKMDPGFISRIFRFVLLDVQMPVMDGRTAARTIRAMNRPDAKTVLMFALSADAFVEDERLSAESGMNGHFAKPVDFAALQSSIGKFLRQCRG